MSVTDDVHRSSTENGSVRRVSAPGTTTGGRRRSEPDRLPAVVPKAGPPAEAEPVDQVRRQRNWALALALLACLALIVFALLDSGTGGAGRKRGPSSALAGPAPAPFVPVGDAGGAEGSATVRPRGDAYVLSLRVDVPGRPYLVGFTRAGSKAEPAGAKLLATAKGGRTQVERRVSLRTLAAYDAIGVHVARAGAKKGTRPVLRLSVLDLLRASRITNLR